MGLLLASARTSPLFKRGWFPSTQRPTDRAERRDLPGYSLRLRKRSIIKTQGHSSHPIVLTLHVSSSRYFISGPPCSHPQTTGRGAGLAHLPECLVWLPCEQGFGPREQNLCSDTGGGGAPKPYPLRKGALSLRGEGLTALKSTLNAPASRRPVQMHLSAQNGWMRCTHTLETRENPTVLRPTKNLPSPKGAQAWTLGSGLNLTRWPCTQV